MFGSKSESSAESKLDTIVARRIDVSSDVLGFEAPPCAVQIKFLPLGADGWTLVALTPPAKPPKVAKWLEQYTPSSIHIAPGLSPKVLRANFDKVPPRWDTFLSDVIVHYLQLTPDGSASLFIEDTPKTVERFLSKVQENDKDARSRKTLAGPERVDLTSRQMELLSVAVALGYYEIPHQVTLRDLAKKVGLSVGAVSELLRRGESLIIQDYIDTMAQTRWDSAAEDPDSPVEVEATQTPEATQSRGRGKPPKRGGAATVARHGTRADVTSGTGFPSEPLSDTGREGPRLEGLGEERHV